MRETGISNQKEVFKYTLKQTHKWLIPKKELLQLFFCCPDPLWVVLLSIVMNILRWSPSLENRDFNYHQSMFWIYIGKHSHEAVQHLASALKELAAFKRLSSSSLPTVCSHIEHFESKHTRCILFIAFVRSLSHCTHSGLGKTLVKKYSIFHSSRSIYEKWMPSELKPCSNLEDWNMCITILAI